MPYEKQNLDTKNNIVSVPFDAEFFFERGIRYFHRDDLPKALKYFQKSLELSPEHPRYMLHIAAAYTEMGNYEESNSWLMQIIHHVEPDMSDCYYYMANNYAHMGDFDQAERYVMMYLQEDEHGIYTEEAEELLDFICFELDRAPRELDTENQLIGKHEKARSYLEQGKFVHATKLLEEMVEEYPQFLAARNNLALAYYYLGHFEKAMSVIEDILERDQANLHALCNLAVFLKHKGMKEPLHSIIQGLRKIQPILPEQQYKLATTLGILGEDQRAYELFLSLAKKGLYQEASLYHYIAVAAFNTGNKDRAHKVWEKARMLYPDDEVLEYYLSMIREDLLSLQHRLPYHYQLPYDVQIKKKGRFTEGKEPEELLQDPLIRSSLFWSLRHGDEDTKLQVIQSFQYFADHEVEEALRQFIVDSDEDDYMKKMAIFVLGQIGAQPPFIAHIQGREIEIDQEETDEHIPQWMKQWQEVIECLRNRMEGNDDILEHLEAQKIWTQYLRVNYPHLPTIRKPEGWAAAIEWIITQKQNRKSLSKKVLAARYGVSVQTITNNAKRICESIFLDR